MILEVSLPYLNEFSSYKVCAASQSVAVCKELRHAHALQVLQLLIRSYLLLGIPHGVFISRQAHSCNLARDSA